MPIVGTGWELHIQRLRTQTMKKPGDTRTRTIGSYQVYRDGAPVAKLAGTIAEQKGPSDSTASGNLHDRRIEGGRFELWTQDGTKYKTIKYNKSASAATNFQIKPRPGIELIGTGKRLEILIHPAVGFLSSEGCIHPCDDLPSASTRIDFASSRKRVLALIGDMQSYLGAKFPAKDGLRIPNAWAVIDEIAGS
jgi:hypothetical protein